MNNKILILRTENIGDFILSIPALISIKNKYGNNKITLVIKKENKELAKKLNFKNIVLYQDPLSKRNLKKIDILIGIPKIIKFLNKIRKNNYDTVIEFSGRKYNKLLINLIKAKNKITGHTKEIEQIDELIRCNKTVEKLCKVKIINELPLKLTKNEKLKFNKILPQKKFIIIHALTPIKEKNWPLKNVILLTKNLKEFKIIFIGSKKDYYKIQKEIINKTNNTINFCGKIGLTQTYHLIKKSKLFIGVDSGPLHLARFTKTPIITIFGNTNEKRWAPKKNCKIIKSKNTNLVSLNEVLKNLKNYIK